MASSATQTQGSPQPSQAEIIARARQLEAAGSWSQASACLLPLVESDPPVAEAAYRLASIKLKEGDLDGAEFWLRRGLESRYEDARIHTNLGVVLDLKGKRDEAIRAFRRAVAVAPHEPAAHLNLGALYGEMGRYEDAVLSLSRCLELSRSFDATFNLGLVRFRQGELAEAERLFRQALDIEKRHALAHYYLGLCRSKRGLVADAVEAFAAALGLDGELVRARYHLGRSYSRLGKFHDAVRELKKVARALPDDVQVHQQLGFAYDGLGMKAESLKCFRRARMLDGV